MYDDLVVDAGLRVQPLVGRGLAGASQRDEHALSYVLLGQADLAGLQAVYIDVERGVGDLLMNVRVGYAGNGLHLFEKLLGELVVVLGTPGDLEIDGCGQAEVEDLVRDVRRSEEEGTVRELLMQVRA